MSDWMATHSASLMAGLDMEMPYNASMIPAVLKPALAAGSNHLRAGDAFEHGVRNLSPDSCYQSRPEQIARRLASNQSDAQGHRFSG